MPRNPIDRKWYDALTRITVALGGSPNVALYFEDDKQASVDAERTIRHFLEVTCNLRVPVDTTQHRVPLTRPGETHPPAPPITVPADDE